MKNRLPLIVSICLAILAFLLCKDLTFFSNTDTFSTAQGGAWSPVLYFRSNAFLSWRADPWIALLASSIASGESQNAYQLALAVLFGTGLALYLKAQRIGGSDAIGGAVAATIACALAVRADTVAWSTVAWMPWIAVALQASRRSGEFFLAVFLLLFALRAATTANHTVLLTYLGAAALSLLPGEAAPQSKNREVLSILAWVILVAGYLLFLGTVEHASFPKYPPFARLVPDDGIPGITRPLIGPDTSIPVLFHRAVQSSSKIPAAVVLLLSAALFPLGRGRSALASRAAIGAALAAGAVLWDCITDESIAQIGPIGSLSRLIPDLFLPPLSPVVVVFGITLAAVSFAALRLRFAVLPVTAAALGVIIFPRLQNLRQPLDSHSSVVAGLELEDMAAPDWIQASADVPGYEPLDWQAALQSPSRFVARHFGRGALAMSYLPAFTAPEPIGPHLQKIWASEKPELLPQLSDGHSDTRYSPGGGHQAGTEKIVVWLKEPLTLSGIALQTGKFVTDFPRGIKITGGTACGETPESVVSGSALLASYPSWQGPPKRAESRLPYFGGQGDVRIPFSKPETIACFAIFQTGVAPHFDWSVAELGLLLIRPPQPSS